MSDKPKVVVKMGFRVAPGLHSRFMRWLAGRKYQDVFTDWMEDAIAGKKPARKLPEK